jgi:2-polyprenyl-3-methyl-5-hydroxy-6-metoxy-1,4-benzoquinol methylase
MQVPPAVIAEDFDRIARAMRDRPDRVDPIVAELVAAVAPGERVLDAGCGGGALARHLAARGAAVTAIDVSPGMIELARGRGSHGVDFQVGDLMAWRAGGFDWIVSVATLHHLPLGAALAHLGSLLSPRGRLVIVDLFDGMRLAEAPYGLVSLLVRAARRHLQRTDPVLASAWAAHGTHDHLLSLGAIRGIYRHALPDARVRRHLGWRYSASWIKTGGGA